MCVESRRIICSGIMMYLDSDENGIEQSTGEVKSLAVGPDRFGRQLGIQRATFIVAGS